MWIGLTNQTAARGNFNLPSALSFSDFQIFFLVQVRRRSEFNTVVLSTVKLRLSETGSRLATAQKPPPARWCGPKTAGTLCQMA